jgi:nitroimidazol reductase NimA-like FMN-containing flavoprotein (pyridoxamine 5'-phosphate oxidase superfamily)
MDSSQPGGTQPTAVPPSATVELSPRESWALVREAVVGRLAVIVGASPEIFPVNHVVDRGTVVFRTGRGTKLSAALENPAVAFEVDGYDAVNGQAWSVVVKGRAEEVREMYDVLEVIELPIFPWHAAPKSRFMRIDADTITGRRFHVLGGTTTSGAPVPDEGSLDQT